MSAQLYPHSNPNFHNFQLNFFDAIAIFEATPDPYLILNTDLTIAAVNNAYLEATSTIRGEIIGRGIFNVFPDNPDDPSATGVRNLRASLQRVIKSKKPDRMELQKYDIPNHESGEFEERYWSPLNTPVLSERGDLMYIIHHVEDVTESVKTKLQKADLEVREARFKQIANAIPQIVWSARPDGFHDYFNERYYDFTGAPPGSMHGEDWIVFHHPDDREKLKKLWKHSLETGELYEIEYRMLHHTGEWRWVLGRALPVKNDEGKILRWFGTCTDIHDQKVAQEALEESEAKFRTMANALPQLVWTTDADGVHDYFNDRFYQYTGQPVGTSTGHRWFSLIHPDDKEKLRDAWRHSLSTGDKYEIEYRIKHKSGEYRWLLGRAVPIRNKDGKVIRWFGTSTEIHEQIKTRAELNDAIRDREMFFSIASHELKTPLTALTLQTQMQLRKLKTDDLNSISLECLRDTMEKIHQQTNRLVKLVDEMLDVSRITSGKLTLQLGPCDLCEIIKEVLGRLIPQFQNANVEPPELESCQTTQGNWDHLKIEQVVTNLLTNALRYGNGKPIKLRLESDDSVVRFSVVDQGIGISEESKAKVFNRFERATNTSKAQGLGLGLFITKEFVQAHGGKIWVESELGKGSTFTVELPKNPAIKTGS